MEFCLLVSECVRAHEWHLFLPLASRLPSLLSHSCPLQLSARAGLPPCLWASGPGCVPDLGEGTGVWMGWPPGALQSGCFLAPLGAGCLLGRPSAQWSCVPSVPVPAVLGHFTPLRGLRAEGNSDYVRHLEGRGAATPTASPSEAASITWWPRDQPYPPESGGLFTSRASDLPSGLQPPHLENSCQGPNL